MGGVVVEDDVDWLVGGDLALEGVEKRVNSTWRWALLAAPDDGAVEHAECGAQGRGAVPLVVVRHGFAASGLERQAELGAVERWDLAFFIDRQHHGVGRRIDTEPDDISELVGRARIPRTLEGVHSVRLYAPATCAAPNPVRCLWPWPSPGRSGLLCEAAQCRSAPPSAL